MRGWRECTLGDAIILQRGHDLPVSKMIEGSYPVAGSNGIIGYHNDLTTKAIGVTIGRSGNLGNSFLYKRDFWAHNTTLYVKDFKGNDEVFIYYFLKTIDFKSFNVGSAVPTLNRNHIHPIKILLPPLQIQRSIASILSSLDDKIDLLHRQNQTLEKMAETLFRQWFVEEAKEDWEMRTFETWVNGTLGGDWGKEVDDTLYTKAVYCIRGTDIADLKSGLALKTPIRFIKENKFQSICPMEGDLIIEISGGTENQSTGRICYINDQVKTLFDYPLVFSNFCRLLRIRKPEYSYFVYSYIQFLYNQDEFFNLENGSSGIKNLDYKALLFENEYLMPDVESVNNFHNRVNPLFRKINQNKFQIRSLTALRDTLLPKLMSGEVKLKRN